MLDGSDAEVRFYKYQKNVFEYKILKYTKTEKNYSFLVKELTEKVLTMKAKVRLFSAFVLQGAYYFRTQFFFFLNLVLCFKDILKCIKKTNLIEKLYFCFRE